MQLEFNDIEKYLKSSYYVDYDNANIKNLVQSEFKPSDNQIETIEKAYLFVRDEICHSWDIQSSNVTVTASQALAYKEGICYAKSNLLAAILRSLGIPAGFCYQRLSLFDTSNSPFCIHALNAVYIDKINKWIRLDARGNKEGINARFSLNEEHLAFCVREDMGEIDYPLIYAEPVKCTMEALENNIDALAIYLHNLPSSI
ncbi:MAG: transglutaminase family protein [Eubacteriaceae bacterium]|nr:transglutaminase family protein [Eubacteriaceae bacterium]